MPDAPDYSRKWMVLATVAVSILVATASAGIVNVALPTLVTELNSTFAAAQWVILIYVLTQATLMPIIGRLGDIVGRKPIFVSGYIVFGVGSLLCGLAPTIYWLIGFRIIQAVGGAMMLTLGFALIVEAFPASERGRAVGSVSIFSSTGTVLGPVIGGLMLSSLDWRWLFFATVPVSILGMAMTMRYVPESKPTTGQRFDYLGAVTLFVSLLALLLALTAKTGGDAGEGRTLALYALAAIAFVVFVVAELRAPQPMIELRLSATNSSP
ncbi:MAG: MFS transporter [Caldilineaceae bacterium]|nr:MFS transporter [Caldilineaceae bacterium]